MKFSWTRLLFTIFMILLFGCVTTGSFAQDSYKSGPLPAWKDNPPADDETSMYFVGTGENADGSLAEAEKAAIEDIVSQIVKFVGVTVTSTTTTVAAGNLDEFEAMIEKEVIETGSARMAGFRVKEKWSNKTARGITVAILVAYEKKALLAEKDRLEKIFIDVINAIRIPEAEGDEYAGEGRFYQAALRYIDAAVAAAESTLEDRAVAFNRTIAKAMSCLEKINLVKLNDNLKALTGEQPSEAFKLKAATGGSKDTAGVPETAFLVTYYESRGGKDLLAKTVSLLTGPDGILAFLHPKTTFAGSGKILMTLDLAAQLEKLKRAEKTYPEKVAGLRALAQSKKVEFQFTVLSGVKDIPLAIFVVDCDENETPYAQNQQTASGIRESLSRQGFQMKTLQLNAALLFSVSDAELASLILKNAPGTGRAVVGTAVLDSYYEDEGRFIVKVRGTVKVIDLATGKVLYEKSLQKTATGANLASARNAAFKQMGNELGTKIAVDVK